MSVPIAHRATERGWDGTIRSNWDFTGISVPVPGLTWELLTSSHPDPVIFQVGKSSTSFSAKLLLCFLPPDFRKDVQALACV